MHPTRRCGSVQRRATSRRYQRSSVRGLTEKTAHAYRGSARLSAVNNSRSASRSCGRRFWRHKMTVRAEAPGSRTPSTPATDKGAPPARTDGERPRTQATTACATSRGREWPTLPVPQLSTAPHCLDPGDRVFEPTRILTREPQHRFRDTAVRPWAAGPPRIRPAPRDQLPMPAQSVAGETRNDDQTDRGSERLSAASSTRSAGPSRGCAT
jgi:hypothetical protein